MSTDDRGPEVVRLAARITVSGVLDPLAIVEPLRTGRPDPQNLKKIWPCLARFGGADPATETAASPSCR